MNSADMKLPGAPEVKVAAPKALNEAADPKVKKEVDEEADKVKKLIPEMA